MKEICVCEWGRDGHREREWNEIALQSFKNRILSIRRRTRINLLHSICVHIRQIENLIIVSLSSIFPLPSIQYIRFVSVCVCVCDCFFWYNADDVGVIWILFLFCYSVDCFFPYWLRSQRRSNRKHKVCYEHENKKNTKLKIVMKMAILPRRFSNIRITFARENDLSNWVDEATQLKKNLAWKKSIFCVSVFVCHIYLLLFPFLRQISLEERV